MFKTPATLLCGFVLGFLFNSSLYLIPEMTVRFAEYLSDCSYVVLVRLSEKWLKLQSWTFILVECWRREERCECCAGSWRGRPITTQRYNWSNNKYNWLHWSVQAVHIKNTWGAHCDKLIFMSSQEDPALGAVALNISEGRQNLWGKTKGGLKKIRNFSYSLTDLIPLLAIRIWKLIF